MLFKVAIPVCFIRLIFTCINLIREMFLRKHPKSNLLFLILIPAAFWVPLQIGIPSFEDGVAQTLRKLDISDPLVAVATEEIAMLSPADLSFYSEDDKWIELSKKDPFPKLNLDYPHLKIQDSCLLLGFGSPIADRWGISISGIKDKPPTIPKYGFEPKVVSTEIVVYSFPRD